MRFKKLSTLLACSACVCLGVSSAQENLVVERCTALDNSTPIQNLWVDDEGQKWIANDDGLFMVHACDLAQPADLKSKEYSILQIADGNAQLQWNRSDFEAVLAGGMVAGDQVTCAYYRSQGDQLWIGTESSGLLLLKTKPQLSLVRTMNVDNSKLKSNYIHTVAFDSGGRQFVGTEDGVLIGRSGKWTLEERYFRFQAMAANGSEMWLLSEDMIWIVDRRNNFTAAEIDPDMVEGEIKDIAFDTSGRLWIASEYLTWYDPSTLDYKVFDGADYFTSSYVNCIAVDNDGAVWVGTDDKGLYLIEEASAMTVTCLLDQPLSCEGNENNAKLSVKINGGHPPYRYAWDKGFTGSEPSGLAAGTYTVTVTDSKGKYKTAKGVVPNPRMTLTFIEKSPATHGGNKDGSATVSIDGGIPDYTYAWDNGETTATASRLGPGEHSVMVVDDNGCRADGSVTIEESLGALAVEINQTGSSTCANENSNSLEVIITGGLKPYVSSWSNPTLMGSKLYDLASGYYGITVTDQQGNEASAEITIPALTPFEVVTRAVKSASTNQSDGSAIARLQGGVEPFYYAWSNGETTKTAERLPAGVHSVIVRDSIGCEATGTIEVTEDILALSVDIAESSNLTCYQSNDGTVTLAIQGGKSPYTISWHDSKLSGQHLEGLAPGTYAATVSDVSGLEQTLEIEITEPAEFTGTFEVETAAMIDSADGSATVELAGGVPPLQFAWDNGETTRIASGLTGGDHTVTITDASGCELVLTGTIAEHQAPLAIEHTVLQEIRCHGTAGGSVQVLARGGRPPYTYTWSDSITSGTQSSQLAAGSYSVSVRDSEGSEATVDFLLQEPLAYSVELKQTEQASIGGADGAAQVFLPDQFSGFTYQWENGSSTARAEGLAKGTYRVTITDSIGCEFIEEIEITEDIPELFAEVNLISPVNCFGQSTAGIEVKASGGTGVYSYTLNGEPVQAAVINGLVAGDYSVGVFDNSGQSYSVTVPIGQPELLQTSIEILEPATVGESNGIARANVSGGRGPYTFSWSNSSSRQIVDSLSAGALEVLVTDQRGCTATAQSEITETILPLVVNLEITKSNPCSGDNLAEVQSQIKGGKGPYTYAWSTGSDSADVRRLAAGEYTLTVTDIQGTTQSSSITIESWEPLNATINQTSVASTDEADGAAEAIVSGGAAPYFYKWSNGDVRSSSSTLAAGLHQIEIRDDKGCRITREFEITEDVTALVASISVRAPIDCAEGIGSLEVDIQGGKKPYEITWDQVGTKLAQMDSARAGTYSVQVTDALGTATTAEINLVAPNPLTIEIVEVVSATTNASDGQINLKSSGGTGEVKFAWKHGATGGNVADLAAGIYTVTATDANGCITQEEIEITEDIQALTLDLDLTQLTCADANDGAARLQIRGGKSPYQIDWSDSQLSGEVVSALAPGNYSVKVSDVLGTVVDKDFEIPAPKAINAQVEIIASANANASDGVAEVQASGGSEPYQYQWSNGAKTAELNDVAAGEYQVTVSDANGCTTQAEVEITEDIQDLAVDISLSQLTCPDAKDGAARLQIRGGKSPYQLDWSDPQLSGQEISALGPGSYTVKISDVLGTTIDESFEIIAPAAIQVEVATISSANVNASDGRAQARATGGTEPYEYLWSSGASTAEASDLSAGDYQVTVTDANGCVQTAEITLTEDIQELVAEAETTAESCPDAADGGASLNISGGKPPYSILWSDERTTQEVDRLEAGGHQAIIRDALGTEVVVEVRVDPASPLEVETKELSPATVGERDGSAEVSGSGGTKPYSYTWSSGDEGAIVEGLAPDEYTVTVSDANGCQVDGKVTITEDIKELQVDLVATEKIKCFGDSSAAANVQVRGGKGPYTFSWDSDLIFGEEVQGLPAGSYALTVEDASGQSQVTEISFDQPDALEVAVVDLRPATDKSTEDGKARLHVSGGVPPYLINWHNGRTEDRIEGLPAGKYIVTVQDANGCSVTLEYEILEKLLPALTAGKLRDGQVVKMEQLTFEADSTQIDPASEPVLNELYEFLKDNPNIVVQVEGHTNGIPEHEYCDRISKERARVVAQNIVDRGISGKRVYFKGFGKRKPLFSNDTAEGRRKNQRVEIRILRLSDQGDN